MTIEMIAGDEFILGRGRFSIDRHGYAEMLACCRRWPDQVWAIEGCNGIGLMSPIDCSPTVRTL